MTFKVSNILPNGNNIGYYIVITIILFALFDQCTNKVKTKIETVTKIERITDTVKETIIKEVPKTVYVEKIKTVKGKDSIIYQEKPTDSTIKANKYETQLKANDATADLQITTTGTLLDVQGSINYPKITETTTITKTKPESGLFLFGSAPINNNFNDIELGLMYNFKNKLQLGVGGQYNNFINNIEPRITLAIKL